MPATIEWTTGYVAALRDLQTLGVSRDLLTPGWQQLFADLFRDAAVIEHELENREQRNKLRAAAQPD